MEQLVSLPWIALLSVSIGLIGALTGLVLLVTRNPSGKWLGALTILVGSSPLLVVLEQEALLPLSSALLSWIYFHYLHAFFYQRRRIPFQSWLVPVIVAVAFFVIDAPMPNLALSLVIVFTYGFQCLQLLRQESKIRGFSYFSNPGGRIAWIRNFTVLQLIILVEWMAPTYTEVLLIICVIYLLLVWLPLVRESSFLEPIPIGNKYKKSTLNPAIKASILEKLEVVMLEEHFYRQDDASLSTLAEKLGATTHHLSQVLNESLSISFQDLIARYRIREACLLLRDDTNKQVKIENIAAMVGYNSKSAFNTAFKKRTGLTPSEYRTKKDVLTYGEERLSERKVPGKSDSTFALNHVNRLKIDSDMILHFLKTFRRTISRNGLFSLLNVLGLSIAFTSSILIYLYINDELSFDTGIKDYDRIYRIAWMSDNPQTRTPHPLAQAMVADLPEVEEAVSLSPWYGPGLTKTMIRVKNVKTNISFEEPDFFFADSTLLDVFGFEVVEGDEKALSEPFSFVISESLAKKYFGDSSAIGQELLINDMPLAVSAVIADMPRNSHFHIQGIISYVTLKQINPDDNWMTWSDFGHFNYIKTKPDVDPKKLEEKIPEWVIAYLKLDDDWSQRLRTGEVKFALQPITSIHLDSHVRWELEDNGNRLYVYILSATLAFLLLIAAINYVNLTTSKSVERAKEVGVRKTLGALSNRLAVQFYAESVLFSLAAVIISFGFAALLLPSFNELSGKQVSSWQLIEWSFLTKAFLVGIGIGLLAGAYPAFALSSFRPSEVLKGKLATSSEGVRIRGVLVVLQFTISAILIAGSLIIMRQIDYMRTTSLGFDKEAVISLSVPLSVEYGGVNLPGLRSAQKQLEAISGIKKTTLISGLPGGQFNQHSFFPANDPDNRVDASEVMVDYNFVEVFGMNIIDGRAFDRSFGSDSAETILVNETLVNNLNLENPVGTRLTMDNNGEFIDVTIIGVVEDFHYQSLHESIQPLIMVLQPDGAAHLVVKLDGNSFASTIGQIEPIYAQMEKDLPFEYHFLDNQLAELYDQEELTLKIFSVFSMIALVLAALGLIGMSIALLNQRIKEIGMRKILGASSMQIMQMVLGQFLRLVGIALLIGLPVAYWVMQEWMQEFSYQAPFGWMPFISSIAILIIVATVSVSSAVSKITFSNPIDSLRYE